MGVPQNRWFISGQIPLKWMMTGGSPFLGNLQFSSILEWDLPWNKPSSQLGVPPISRLPRRGFCRKIGGVPRRSMVPVVRKTPRAHAWDVAIGRYDGRVETPRVFKIVGFCNSKIGSDFRDIGWNQQYNTANSQAIFWGLEFGWKNGPPAQSGFHQHTSKIQFHQLFGCENHGIRWRLTPYPTTDPQRNDSNWVSEINIFGLVGVG